MRRSAALSFVFLLLVGCGGKPATFDEVDPSIKHFDAAGPNLNFTSEIELITDGEIGLMQIGQVVSAIGDGIQAGLPGLTDQSKYVQLQMHFASTDRLGNEGFVDFGTLRIPVADLKAAKLENLGGLRVLALADQLSPGPAFDLAMDYCADPANFGANSEFCGRVAEAVS